jgi:hypothetical protein
MDALVAAEKAGVGVSNSKREPDGDVAELEHDVAAVELTKVAGEEPEAGENVGVSATAPSQADPVPQAQGARRSFCRKSRRGQPRSATRIRSNSGE